MKAKNTPLLSKFIENKMDGSPLITLTMCQLGRIHLSNKTILSGHLKFHMLKICHLQQQLYATTIHSLSIILILCNVDYNNKKFIHAPTYIYNEVTHLLELVGVVEDKWSFM